MQGIKTFDFMEMESAQAVADRMPVVFIAATLILLIIAVVGRIRQIRI